MSLSFIQDSLEDLIVLGWCKDLIKSLIINYIIIKIINVIKLHKLMIYVYED